MKENSSCLMIISNLRRPQSHILRGLEVAMWCTATAFAVPSGSTFSYTLAKQGTGLPMVPAWACGEPSHGRGKGSRTEPTARQSAPPLARLALKEATGLPAPSDEAPEVLHSAEKAELTAERRY